jgi:protein phosphatase
MKFVAGNAQHIGARPEQQDAFGFSDPGNREFVAHAGFLGVVADGMGGLAHGSAASQTAVLAFLQAYGRKKARESIPDALMRCLREANGAVLRVAEKISPRDELGTTLVAAVLHESCLYWVSCGDSRIYLARGKFLTRLTSDHTLARELNQ